MNIFNRIPRWAIPRTTSTMIVCGDCCGDGLLPLKTYLTANGRCAACGGRNYEFASRICDALARHLIKQGENENDRRRNQQQT